LIQDQVGTRNNDSKEPVLRFDSYKFPFHTARLATFATQSAQSDMPACAVSSIDHLVGAGEKRGYSALRRVMKLQSPLFKSWEAPKALRRYPKAQITQERPAWFPKNASRCPKKSKIKSPWALLRLKQGTNGQWMLQKRATRVH